MGLMDSTYRVPLLDSKLVGFIPVNLSTRKSTCRNLPTYLQTLTGSSNVSESWKETTRKSKETVLQPLVKWQQSVWRVGISTWTAHALSGLSCQVSACCLPQPCNLEGMSMNIQRKNPPITSVCKVNANRLYLSWKPAS